MKIYVYVHGHTLGVSLSPFEPENKRKKEASVNVSKLQTRLGVDKVSMLTPYIHTQTLRKTELVIYNHHAECLVELQPDA